MEVVASQVGVSLVVVSKTELEKNLKLSLRYEREKIRGNIMVYKVRRWLSDAELGIWEQDEVILEELDGVYEKEYVLPAGVPGVEEYTLKVAFFDSNGHGHAIYPPEQDPSITEEPPQEEPSPPSP